MIKRKFMRSPTIVNSIIGSMDQVALSALSFFISIILIKNVSKIEYGYYSIGFTISLFLIAVQNAVVNTPLAVLLITKNGSEKKNYIASLCYGQFIVIIPAVCFSLFAAALAKYWGLDSTQISVAAALSLASVGILFREFMCAYFFAEEKPQRVLKMDLFYAVLFISGVGLIYLFFKISVALIFILMGISGLLAAMVFSWSGGWHQRQTSIKKSYRENWQYGKWALVGVVVTHVQNYSYLYLLGALLGSMAVADVSAARLLMMPMILARAGWMRIAVPHGSRLREQKQLDRFFKELVLACLVFALIVVLYTATLMSFSGLLQTLLFTQKYTDSLGYILYYAVIFIISFTGVNASYGLQVTKKFDIITKINFFTMLVTLGCAYLFIKGFGIKGALTALIIGEALVSGMLWFYFAKIVFFKRAEGPTASLPKIIFAKFSKGETATMIKE